MKRFAIHISIALFTFGIGLIAVFSCSENIEIIAAKHSEKTSSSQHFLLLEPQESFIRTYGNNVQEKELPTKLSCRDEKIIPVWKELLRDKYFREWEQNFHESLDCKDMIETKEFDLNQDNKQEILIRGKNFNLCSAVGNCGFWIYKRKGNRYKRLLYSTDYTDVTELPNQVKRNKTKEYFNILLKGHYSASDTIYTYYIFDGQKYRENKCLVDACVICSGDNPTWEFVSCKKFFKRFNSNR